MGFLLFLNRFRDFFIVLGLTSSLEVIHIVLDYCSAQNWHIFQVDVNLTLVNDINKYIFFSSFLSVVLSIFIFPIAAFASASNEYLSRPIRWLTTAESINKLVFTISYAMTRCCQLLASYSSPGLGCSADLSATLTSVYHFLVLDYGLYEIAQYFQFMISLSRFFAVSFDGTFFRYTQKWPLVQVLIPFVVRIGLEKLRLVIGDSLNDNAHSIIDDHIVLLPCYMMCALDVMTYRRLRKMLSNSLTALISTVLYAAVAIIVTLFFGNNLLSVYWAIILFVQLFFFCFIASLMNVICLSKPRSPQTRSTISISTRLTNP